MIRIDIQRELDEFLTKAFERGNLNCMDKINDIKMAWAERGNITETTIALSILKKWFYSQNKENK